MVLPKRNNYSGLSACAYGDVCIKYIVGGFLGGSYQFALGGPSSFFFDGGQTLLDSAGRWARLHFSRLIL